MEIASKRFTGTDRRGPCRLPLRESAFLHHNDGFVCLRLNGFDPAPQYRPVALREVDLRQACELHQPRAAEPRPASPARAASMAALTREQIGLLGDVVNHVDDFGNSFNGRSPRRFDLLWPWPAPTANTLHSFSIACQRAERLPCSAASKRGERLQRTNFGVVRKPASWRPVKLFDGGRGSR